jgi:PPK2 family polyphosphate:nucleotide phosphotransferase
MKGMRKIAERLMVAPGSRVSLKEFDPEWTGSVSDPETSARLLAEGISELSVLQNKLFAQNQHAVLVIIQAMDAGGKDSIIRHVMSGLNPQGCQVFSFKAPSAEERDHTYLWRAVKALPERGRIGIHNRSHYEEVLIARVHPRILQAQQLPDSVKKDKNIWKRRFHEINDFERHLVHNGTRVVKFFLHVSKAEQKRRFLERIDDPSKNWKFSTIDVEERGCWKDYMHAYEDALSETSTKWAPWYVVPADHKWFTRLAVAGILCRELESLDLDYPKITPAQRKELAAARHMLMNER